jgi:lipooligosaccharide transport system ATP-binding protein
MRPPSQASPEPFPRQLTWPTVGPSNAFEAPTRALPGSREPLVVARGLVKRFGGVVAVDGIDFTIGRGESYGFLGPNGAGKTSTMRMIACMSPVSAGMLQVLGRSPDRDGPEIRRRIGLVPQEDTLDLELTVLDNLLVYGRYFDLPRRLVRERADELLDFVQLNERARDKVDSLSGGMKRRLTIARALVSEPELLILDEPTTGLDPQARHLLWDRLYRLRRRGVTLVITTHYMDEAEQLCERLAVMDQGRFAAEGAPQELIARYSTREVVELRFGETEPAEVAARLDGLAERREVLPDRILLYSDDGDATLGQVHRLGLTPESTLVRRASLEDVFLHLTGRTLVD